MDGDGIHGRTDVASGPVQVKGCLSTGSVFYRVSVRALSSQPISARPRRHLGVRTPVSINVGVRCEVNADFGTGYFWGRVSFSFIPLYPHLKNCLAEISSGPLLSIDVET